MVALAAVLITVALGLAGAAPAVARDPLPHCSDNIDNDGDTKVDYPYEPGCTSIFDESEPDQTQRPVCSDGADSQGGADGDAIKDFPGDPGCASASGGSESNPSPLPACGNGTENDSPSDGKKDYPDDPGCSWAAETSEADTQCSNDRDDDGDGRADFPADLGCITTLVGTTVTLADNDATEIDLPQCDDGRDNDGDGLVDRTQGDPDCLSTTDDSEAPPPQCSDGADNDGDGTADFPNDPGCAFAGDTDETNAPPSRCSDGADNDADGRIDGADQGCSSAADDDETDTVIYVLPSVNTPSSTPLLSPFPLVRLRGQAERRGVRITLLTVKAPKGSRVTVRCSGPPGCPTRRLTQTVGARTERVRRFERRLRAGATLRIYVTKPGFVGKYTRFRILRNRPPSRVDRCTRKNEGRPLPCPST